MQRYTLTKGQRMLNALSSGNVQSLVVGIVVDQMRWDYLSRYYDKFCEDGFRRMLDKGYSFDNCLIDYVPIVNGHWSYIGLYGDYSGFSWHLW